jgi:hypothetical protein
MNILITKLSSGDTKQEDGEPLEPARSLAKIVPASHVFLFFALTEFIELVLYARDIIASRLAREDIFTIIRNA